MPPAPRPCTTRPTTSSGIVGALPATSSPATNSATPTVNGYAGPRASAALPDATMPTRFASMKPLNVQPYSARPPISRTVMGRTVATASASNAVNATVATRPTVSARCARSQTPPPASSAAPAAGEGSRIRALSHPAAGKSYAPIATCLFARTRSC